MENQENLGSDPDGSFTLKLSEKYFPKYRLEFKCFPDGTVMQSMVNHPYFLPDITHFTQPLLNPYCEFESVWNGPIDPFRPELPVRYEAHQDELFRCRVMPRYMYLKYIVIKARRHGMRNAYHGFIQHK